MPERSVSVGPFLGLNNKRLPTELGAGTREAPDARYLYGADNVDLTARGGLKRRPGFALQTAGDAHSLWSDEQGAFAVVDGTLCAVAESGSGIATAPLRSGLPDAPVSYARAGNGVVYWSNALELRCIVQGADLPISAAPALAPTVTASAGGALPAGLYIVAFTWPGPQGESAPTHAVQIEVPAGGRLDFADTAGATVWLSGPNGDHVSSCGVVTAVEVLSQGGRISRTLNTAPMPAGHLVRMHQGSLVVAHENVVFVSVPYANGIYEPARGYIVLPAKVTVMESVGTGMFICADKTYWISTFFADAGLQERLPFGGLLGSGVCQRHEDETKAYWQTPVGLAVGDATGAVQLLQRDALRLPPAAYGSTLYRMRDGRSSVVTSRSGVQPNQAAALAWADAEVIRKETSHEL